MPTWQVFDIHSCWKKGVVFLTRVFQPAIIVDPDTLTTTATPPRGISEETARLLNCNRLQVRVYQNLSRCLGYGGRGKVGLWLQKNDRKQVAVKKFCKPMTGENKDDYTARILVEYLIGKRLRHDNIVRVHELIYQQGQWFQVMEFVPVELFHLVENKRLRLDEMSCIFAQITSGMAYLHNAGFAHRDLKLENVMISKDGVAKIIDLGCALAYDKELDRCLVGGLCGSTPYMAPEMFHFKLYEARAADVWSAGIIFCAMVLGRFPWAVAKETNPGFQHFLTQSTEYDTKARPHHSRMSSSFTHSSVEDLVSINDVQDTCGTSHANLARPSLITNLPKVCQEIISGILQPEPQFRLDFNAVLSSSWVQQTPRYPESFEQTHKDAVFQEAFDEEHGFNLHNTDN